MDMERSFEEILVEYAKRRSPLWCYQQIELLARIAIELWEAESTGEEDVL